MRQAGFWLLIAALAAALAVALAVGPYPLSLADILHAARHAIGGETGTPTTGEIVIVEGV